MKVSTIELDADDRRLLHKGAERWKSAILGALNRIRGMGYEQHDMAADLEALAGTDAKPGLIDLLEIQGNLFDPRQQLEEDEEAALRDSAAMSLNLTDRETRVLYFAAKHEAKKVEKVKTSMIREGYRTDDQDDDLLRLEGSEAGDGPGLIARLDRGWEAEEDEDQLELEED